MGWEAAKGPPTHGPPIGIVVCCFAPYRVLRRFGAALSDARLCGPRVLWLVITSSQPFKGRSVRPVFTVAGRQLVLLRPFPAIFEPESLIFAAVFLVPTLFQDAPGGWNRVETWREYVIHGRGGTNYRPVTFKSRSHQGRCWPCDGVSGVASVLGAEHIHIRRSSREGDFRVPFPTTTASPAAAPRPAGPPYSRTTQET